MVFVDRRIWKEVRGDEPLLMRMSHQSFRSRSSTAGPPLRDPFAVAEGKRNMALDEFAVAEEEEDEDYGDWSDVSV